MKIEKVPWDVDSDGVIVGVGLRGVSGRERERRKTCFSADCSAPWGMSVKYVHYSSDSRQGAHRLGLADEVVVRFG